MSSAPPRPYEAASPRRARRRVAIGTVALLVMACNADKLAGPSQIQPMPRSNISGVLGPETIPIPPNNTVGMGALGSMNTSLSVPTNTAFIVKVTGQTSVSNNPVVQECVSNQPIAPSTSIGAAGDAYHQLAVSASVRQPSGAESGLGFWVRDGGNTLITDTLWAATALAVRVARSGIQGSINGQNCSAGLYLLNSGQSITLEILDGVGLQLDPSSVVVRKGTPVSFTARSGGAAVTVPSWEFVPGSTTPANETSACGPNGANPCVVTVKNTGELRAARYLNGRWRSASSQLRVYTTFTLAADKSEVPPGAVVTFTPTLDGVDGIASRWVWRDSTGQAQADPCASINSGKCAYAPTATGTMWAYTNSNDSAFVPVRVRPATLKLNALQTIVLVDSADSFVALGNGAVVIQGWTFRSDFAPMAASSKTSGTDGLRFRPSAGRSPMLAPTGSRRAASVGSAWGACVPGQNACTQSLAEAGTVFVIGTVDGVTLEDSVHVDVLEMPPPIDSLAVEPPGVEYQCPPTYYQSRTWTATATTGEPVTIYSPIIRSVSFPDAGQLDPLYTGIPYGLYTPVLMTSPPNFVGTGVMRMICKTWLLNNTSPTGAPLFGGRLLFHDAVVALSEQH